MADGWMARWRGHNANRHCGMEVRRHAFAFVMLTVLLGFAAGVGAFVGMGARAAVGPASVCLWQRGGLVRPGSAIPVGDIRFRGAGQGGYAGERVGEASHPGPGRGF